MHRASTKSVRNNKTPNLGQVSELRACRPIIWSSLYGIFRLRRGRGIQKETSISLRTRFHRRVRGCVGVIHFYQSSTPKEKKIGFTMREAARTKLRRRKKVQHIFFPLMELFWRFLQMGEQFLQCAIFVRNPQWHLQSHSPHEMSKFKKIWKSQTCIFS